MKTIYAIQHTQSEHHINGMVGSWTDWNLTSLGRQQACNIAAHLAEELEGKEVVLYTSDLKRASQTAGFIAERLKVTPIARKELRERNLGKCCGKSVEWLRENIEHDEITVDDRLFSDGESLRDAWNRLKPFFDEVMASDCETIVIVSHGDILSVFYAIFLGMPVESLCDVKLHGAAGGVAQLIIKDNGSHLMKKMGDMSYLR